MRILLIEDNRTTTEFLSQGLRENYFIPNVAHDGQEGLFLISHNQYDLIILDIMLPLMDGWTLIQHIRQQKPNLPVLFLTAKDSVNDRVKGLELGADDYLVKPFAFSELLARIRSILRRNWVRSPDIIEIANLKIDIQKHKAMRDGHVIPLTAKEFKLLLLFATRVGEVLSRTFIAEQVWDINFDSDTNVIDVAVKRLRDRVDKKYDQKLIHAVRGVGYVFEPR